MDRRRYRTNLEVLRDILQAAQSPSPKTRLIGAANLNPRSFQEYLQFCTDHGLIGRASGGYVCTARAVSVIESIEEVLSKTAELDSAVQQFRVNVTKRLFPPSDNGSALRYVSRLAWEEVVLKGEKRLSLSRSSAKALGRQTARPGGGPEAEPEILRLIALEPVGRGAGKPATARAPFQGNGRRDEDKSRSNR